MIDRGVVNDRLLLPMLAVTPTAALAFTFLPTNSWKGREMYYKMIPYAVGILLMVAAAVRFAGKDDFVGAGIALVAALVASFTAVKAPTR